jgi:hypothetical protein
MSGAKLTPSGLRLASRQGTPHFDELGNQRTFAERVRGGLSMGSVIARARVLRE